MNNIAKQMRQLCDKLNHLLLKENQHEEDKDYTGCWVRVKTGEERNQTGIITGLCGYSYWNIQLDGMKQDPIWRLRKSFHIISFPSLKEGE